MNDLVEEVRLWNTPAVGAFLLYRFTQGYTSVHERGDGPVALYHFIALPILINDKLKAPISNMRSNLQSFAKSFEDNRNIDVLLGIQERVKEKLAFSWSSIDFAVGNGLLFWDYEQAKLFVRPFDKTPGYGHAPKAQLKKDGEKAEILGKWFAEHEVKTICSYLKILL